MINQIFNDKISEKLFAEVGYDGSVLYLTDICDSPDGKLSNYCFYPVNETNTSMISNSDKIFGIVTVLK